MTEKVQITVNDCEELCDRLLRDASPNLDKVSLWEELWRRLANKLGYGNDPNYDLMLPPGNYSESNAEENRIAAVRGELYEILNGHTQEPRQCMKVFDRINAE